MIEKPEVGMQCWIITDIWERFCAVPVTIVAVNEEHGAFLGRWNMESEEIKRFEGLLPNELYATERAAWDAIKEQRRLEE